MISPASGRAAEVPMPLPVSSKPTLFNTRPEAGLS